MQKNMPHSNSLAHTRTVMYKILVGSNNNKKKKKNGLTTYLCIVCIKLDVGDRKGRGTLNAFDHKECMDPPAITGAFHFNGSGYISMYINVY